MIDSADAYELIMSFITLDAKQKLELKKRFDAKLPFLNSWQEFKAFIHKQADNMTKGVEEVELVAYDYGSYGAKDE